MDGAWYDDGAVTLWHGDALDVLAGMPDNAVGAVVTSPPYLDVRSDVEAIDRYQLGRIMAELRRVCSGPALVNFGRFWRDGQEVAWWEDVARDAVEFGGWRRLDTLVWVKPNGNPLRGLVFADSHEFVIVFGDGVDDLDVDAIRTPYAEESVKRLARKWKRNTVVKGEHGEREGKLNPKGARPRSFVPVETGREKGNDHPTPMPEELARHLVLLSGADVVLDPFVGSGTTLVEARKLGRRSIGIDIDARWLVEARERLALPDARGVVRRGGHDQLDLLAGA